ncbi:MAG TPA: hypothetical protein VK986_00180 [Tepidisphaeraceae bacterium]|nr:hypothetical protein [Tepidisphaeraceae bacterium]
MFIVRTSFVALALVAGAAALADDAPALRTRFHNAEFTIPAGFAREPLSSDPSYYVLKLQGIDIRKVMAVDIHVLKERPITGPVEAMFGAWADEKAKSLQWGKDTVVREETPRQWANHPGGGKMMLQHLSYGGTRPNDARNQQLNVFVDGGDVAQAFTLDTAAMGDAAAGVTLMREHAKTFQAFVAGARLLSRDVLVPAPTPQDKALTRYTVEKGLDFLEWLLEVPLTAEQRGQVRDHLIAEWKANDRGEMGGVAELFAVKAEVDKLEDVKKKELARQAVRVELLKNARAEAAKGDKLAGMIVGAHDSAHAPIAAGEPPLTRQASDAALEVLHFMAAAHAGVSTDWARARPDKARLDAFAKSLAAEYPNLPAGAKAEIAGAPLAWAALRAVWPELPAEQRVALAKQWGESPAVAQLAGKLKTSNTFGVSDDVARTMREYNAQRQLIDMGAYRLNYRPGYP